MSSPEPMTKYPVAEAALVHTLWSITQGWWNRSLNEKSLHEYMRPVFTNSVDWEAFDTGLCGYRALNPRAWNVRQGREVKFRWTEHQRWLHRLGLQFLAALAEVRKD